jgi:hypothetical protein
VDRWHEHSQWLKRDGWYWQQPEFRYFPSGSEWRVYNAKQLSRLHLAYLCAWLSELEGALGKGPFPEGYYRELREVLPEHGADMRT